MRPTNDDELIPPFARNTASKAIKDNIKDSELVTTLQDETETKSRTTNILASHAQSLRNERIQEPGRFTGPSSPQRSQRVPPRPMPVEQPQGQVEFKEVQVRPINRNIATLRATRDVNSTGVKSEDDASRDFGEMDAKTLSVKPITAILNEVVKDNLDSKELRLLDSSKDPIVSLVDRVVASKIDPEATRQVFDQMLHRTNDLAQAFLASPKEFWRMFSIFNGILHLSEANACYSMVLRILCEVGARMTNEDAFLACGLFGDYGLPKIVPLLKTKPAKRKGLLGMMYFFCESSMHLRVIKALQDSLDDMDAFLQCIVILMHLEPDGFSEDLLDLYIYYAMTGLGHQSATLRASALSMVVLVVKQSHLLVMPMLDKLEAMIDDGWWEVSAQLLRVCAALLQVLLPQDEQCGRVCDLVTEIVSTTYSPLVRKMAVSCLAPVLSKYTSLESIYHEALEQLSEKDFSTVMAAPDPSSMELGDPQQQVSQSALALTAPRPNTSLSLCTYMYLPSHLYFSPSGPAPTLLKTAFPPPPYCTATLYTLDRPLNFRLNPSLPTPLLLYPGPRQLARPHAHHLAPPLPRPSPHRPVPLGQDPQESPGKPRARACAHPHGHPRESIRVGPV